LFFSIFDLLTVDYRKTDELERSLVSGLKKRNITAYRLVFDLYAPALNGMMAKMLCQDAADEYLVGVFASAWRSIDDYNGETRLFTWLLNIARSHITDIVRVNGATYSKDVFLCNGVVEPELYAVIDMVMFKGYTVKEVAGLFDWPVHEVLKRMRIDLANMRKSISTT